MELCTLSVRRYIIYALQFAVKYVHSHCSLIKYTVLIYAYTNMYNIILLYTRMSSR